MKKKGEVSETDQAELDKLTADISKLSKALEKLRKQSRQHMTLKNDHENKKKKADIARERESPISASSARLTHFSSRPLARSLASWLPFIGLGDARNLLREKVK